jgi:DNA-binding NtrC family response regulator
MTASGPPSARRGPARASSEVETELEAGAPGEHAGETPAAPHVFLIVRRGERHELRELPDGGELTVGRGDECGICLDDTKCSRVHARFRREGDRVTVADLGSTNGTRVNGALLRGAERSLRGGDLVQVGRTPISVAATSGGRPARGLVDLELERLAATGARAALLRIELSAEEEGELERMAAELRGAGLVQEQDEGGYAVLCEGGDVDELRRRLQAAAPGAALGVAAFPADGKSLGELWRAAGRATAAVGSRPTTAPPSSGAPPNDVVVADVAMTKLYRVARRVAQSDTTVLIIGETGSGKEVLAEYLHRHSERAERPYVRLNCASLPESLLSSELFGHERGAFTGATRRRVGYFEATSGGTLLLDEIGELSPTMQVKLLRVLEERTVQRLGASEETAVDVRVLCATHRDLEVEIAAGRFREDLYYRISAITLRVPPLRERPSEIGLLAELFLRALSEGAGARLPRLGEDALAALLSHPWPGNVRELRNAVEHAFLMRDAELIEPRHLPLSLRPPDPPAPLPQKGGVRDTLAHIERTSILRALAAAGGNQTRAARALGMSRRALIYKMEKYGIKRPPGGGDPG